MKQFYIVVHAKKSIFNKIWLNVFFCMISYAWIIVFQNALLETLEEIDGENNINVI